MESALRKSAHSSSRRLRLVVRVAARVVAVLSLVALVLTSITHFGASFVAPPSTSGSGCRRGLFACAGALACSIVVQDAGVRAEGIISVVAQEDRVYREIADAEDFYLEMLETQQLDEQGIKNLGLAIQRQTTKGLISAMDSAERRYLAILDVVNGNDVEALARLMVSKEISEARFVLRDTVPVIVSLVKDKDVQQELTSVMSTFFQNSDSFVLTSRNKKIDRARMSYKKMMDCLICLRTVLTKALPDMGSLEGLMPVSASFADGNAKMA